MKGNDLLRGMSYIDDSFIDEPENKTVKKPIIRYAVLFAASFAIIIAAVSLLSIGENNLPISPDITMNSESPQPDKEYKLNFNKVDGMAARDLYIEGHFWEELNKEQTAKLLPKIADTYELNGTVHYSHKDGVTSVFSVDTQFQKSDKNGTIAFAPNSVVRCCIVEGKPVFSEIEGVKIEAGIFITGKSNKTYIYYADFKLDDVAYYVEYSGNKYDEDFFTSVIADIISGGKADLSVLDNPVVPKLRDDRLTESEAYNDADFGAYLPEVPDSYQFNGATRFINQASDYLYASWSQNYNDIDFKVSRIAEYDRERIVSPDDVVLYDMSLYPIPWADSMPRDKSHIIENPIFRIEDLTLDIVKMREYVRGEEGDPSGNSVCMRFGVLYGDVLVEVSTEGVSSEYMFHELSKLK